MVPSSRDSFIFFLFAGLNRITGGVVSANTIVNEVGRHLEILDAKWIKSLGTFCFLVLFVALTLVILTECIC